MLQVLLSRYHAGDESSLLEYVSDELKQNVKKAKSHSIEVEKVIHYPENIVHKTHYSWFTPILQQSPKKMHPLYLGSLPERHQTNICQLLDLKPPKKPFPAALKPFFWNQFLTELGFNNRLPESLLPQSPLVPLLQRSKNELIRIIDYIALQDLAKEVRKIVDKKQLKKIVSCLSQKRKEFLQSCLRKKDKLKVPPLGLDRWDGKEKSLILMLHKRGMLRFAKALSGQHPDLVWHILHTLDTGRANYITKYLEEQELPGITKALQDHMLKVHQLLYPESVS